jgi:isocitrate dehydrogenase kinase/phosphatase
MTSYAYAAELLRDGFADYHARFRAITQRAQRRFETRDWVGVQGDAVERIELYDTCISEMATKLEARVGAALAERATWAELRDTYGEAIANLLDQELYKTWFNTLARRFFRIRGVDAEVEFLALDIEPTDRITHPVARHSYAVWGHLTRVAQKVLDDYAFAAPYVHAGLCAARIAEALSRRLSEWGADPVRSLEMMQTVFYRERRAYLVGRAFGVDRIAPVVIVLTHEPGGIRADALLTDREHVAQVFSYTRSYFHADLATVGDAVVFLRTLLPHKPIDELYTVLGRAKQGKTERFRHFMRHIAADPDEPFVHADGERGMVMAVFTLPTYPLVFKLIRDRFAYPKDVVRDEVMAKYRLVFHHDRVGRLIDAQEFRFLRFARQRFSEKVLREVLDECSQSAYLDGNDVVIAHCYVERRLRPLNLYLREVEDADALRATIDYGQSIKDLARSNIFPGDMLLKNFGVTRHRRAIFYDYDELCFVTDCNFRALPEGDDYDSTARDDLFYVGPNDVFPEQFPNFLGLRAELREALMAHHADLFDVRWWLSLQAELREGKVTDVSPYPSRVRLTPQALGMLSE